MRCSFCMVEHEKGCKAEFRMSEMEYLLEQAYDFLSKSSMSNDVLDEWFKRLDDLDI